MQLLTTKTPAASAPAPGFLMKELDPGSPEFTHSLTFGPLTMLLRCEGSSGKIVSTLEVLLARDGGKPATLNVVSLSNPSTHQSSHRHEGFSVTLQDSGHSCRVAIETDGQAVRNFGVPRGITEFFFSLERGAPDGEWSLLAKRGQETLFAQDFRVKKSIDVIP